jgi:hypothetical protein
MNANVYIIEDYENETAIRPQKNKPKTNPILPAVGGFKKGQNILPKNPATPSIIYSVDIPLMESTAMV